MIAESRFGNKDVCMHVSETPYALVGLSVYVCNVVDVFGPRYLIANIEFQFTSLRVVSRFRIIYVHMWSLVFCTYEFETLLSDAL